MGVLLSIIVPTKDRYEYLKDCINTILDIESDEFELVIQDNSLDNQEIMNYISSFSDIRLKYFHTKEAISVTENTNLAIQNSTGAYVCFIGDDDSVCEKLIEVTRYAKENCIDSVGFFVVGFNWPDITFTGKKEAPLFFRTDDDGVIEPLMPDEKLKSALHKGFGIDVPRLYHALVSRKCLDRIRASAGTYTPGPSPDMAGAVAVCLTSQKSVFIRLHLIVSGYSFKSARGEGNRKAHCGRIEDKPWLPKNQVDKWDNELPKYFSAETIIAQSAYEALKAMRKEEYIKLIQYGQIYAKLFKDYPEIRKEIAAFLLIKPIRVARFCSGVIKKAIAKIQSSKKYSRYSFNEYYDISSLEAACKAANERNKDKSLVHKK